MLVELNKRNGRLEITLTDKGRAELADGGTMDDLLEYHLCNGWDSLQPEEIGALTACPLILSDDVERDDHNTVLRTGTVYWHENYAVEDAFETLRRTGSITLPGTANENRIFIRVGDGGDYEEVGGLGALVDELRDHNITAVWRCNEYGIEADGYRGQNYISVYYGENVETPGRGLTDEELTHLNAKLEESHVE